MKILKSYPQTNQLVKLANGGESNFKRAHVKEFDFTLFVNLYNNPLESNSKIAKLVGSNKETVRNHIVSLYQQAIIMESVKYHFKEEKTSTRLEINSANLKLHKTIVHVSEIKWLEVFESLWNLIVTYPYTFSATRNLGHDLGIRWVLFLPNEARTLFGRFVFILSQLTKCNINVLLSDKSKHKKHDFSFWDNKLSRWKLIPSELIDSTYSPNNMFDFLMDYYNSPFFKIDIPIDHAKPEKSSMSSSQSNVVKLNKLQINILRELQLHPKIGPKELTKKFNRDISTLSRHLKKVKSQFVSMYHLHFDMQIFGNLSTIEITGKERIGNADFAILHDFLFSSLIPFGCELNLENTTMNFKITLPNQLIFQLVEFFYKFFTDIKISLLDIQSQIHVALNGDLLNNDGTWMVNEELLVYQPIQKIESQIAAVT